MILSWMAASRPWAARSAWGAGDPLALTEDGNPGLVFRRAGSQARKWPGAAGDSGRRVSSRPGPSVKAESFLGRRQGPQDTGWSRSRHQPHTGVLQGRQACPSVQTGPVSSCSCRSGSETRCCCLSFHPPGLPQPHQPSCCSS